MSTKPPRGLFITGTNTEVGKTYVSCLIARALAAAGWRVGVYKPAASGCRHEAGELVADDALQLWEAAGRPESLQTVCPQCFEAPLAPHLAARAEGRQVDAELLRRGLDAWTGHCDIVLVEGAGGLMSPISDEDYVADLAHEFGYPLIVVAANSLGVINQTLQTLITAATFRDGLDIAGVVLNDVQAPAAGERDPSRSSNRQELELRCGPPVLDHVAWNAQSFSRNLDWLALSGQRRS